MYAVLMKQMLYLKMLAWLEDNIYCNPAIDDGAVYGLFASVCVRRVLPVWPVTYRTVYSSTAVDHRSGQSALNTATDRRYCTAVKLSPQTFSREFKKRFSLSPREYRCAAHWDTAKLLKKFHPDGESLPLARFSLPEQVYYGYPMKYELRLSDLVLQSTAKTSIRQRLTVFHRWRRLAFRTFRLRRGEQK